MSHSLVYIEKTTQDLIHTLELRATNISGAAIKDTSFSFYTLRPVSHETVD